MYYIIFNCIKLDASLRFCFKIFEIFEKYAKKAEKK